MTEATVEIFNAAGRVRLVVCRTCLFLFDTDYINFTGKNRRKVIRMKISSQ